MSLVWPFRSSLQVRINCRSKEFSPAGATFSSSTPTRRGRRSSGATWRLSRKRRTAPGSPTTQWPCRLVDVSTFCRKSTPSCARYGAWNPFSRRPCVLLAEHFEFICVESLSWHRFQFNGSCYHSKGTPVSSSRRVNTRCLAF